MFLIGLLFTLIDSNTIIKSTKLSKIILSGALIPKSLVSKLTSELGMETYCLGGPTEDAIWPVYLPPHLMTTNNMLYEGRENIPYGIPIENMKLYIVNKQTKLCPVGVRGEICFSGIGLTPGYLDGSTEGFSMFKYGDSNIRIHKTADVGYISQNGYCEIIGRANNQVKVGGFRIDLSEIENSVVSYNSGVVRNAICFVNKQSHLEHIICVVDSLCSTI